MNIILNVQENVGVNMFFSTWEWVNDWKRERSAFSTIATENPSSEKMIEWSLSLIKNV